MKYILNNSILLCTYEYASIYEYRNDIIENDYFIIAYLKVQHLP